MIEILERGFERFPSLGRYYAQHVGGWKRRWCLLLQRLGALRPLSYVEWLATYGCNMSCPYCGVGAGHALRDELTTAEVRELIETLRPMRVKKLLISGGEPLLRPDLPELMLYANTYSLKVGLVTNGYYVGEQWESLRRIRYFLYLTSIDGRPEYHDRARGMQGAFKRAMESLALVGTIDVPVRIVNTVVHPRNIRELEGMFELVRRSGANVWQLSPVAPDGRAAAATEYALKSSELRYLCAFVRQKRSAGLQVELGESRSYISCFSGNSFGKPFFCGAGLTKFTIMPGGQIAGCQPLFDAGWSEGNVRDARIQEIWKAGFVRLRRREEHGYCRNCGYLLACQGGCRAELEKQQKCLKSVWDEGE